MSVNQIRSFRLENSIKQLKQLDPDLAKLFDNVEVNPLNPEKNYFKALVSKDTVFVGGMITKIVRRYDKRNREMAFFDLDCLGGHAEIVVFSDCYRSYIEGDQFSGLRTFPIVFGMNWSVRIIISLCVLIIFSAPIPYLKGAYGPGYIISLFIGVELP